MQIVKRIFYETPNMLCDNLTWEFIRVYRGVVLDNSYRNWARLAEYILLVQYMCVPREYSETFGEELKFPPAYNKRCHHYLPRILCECKFFELGNYLRCLFSFDCNLDEKLAVLAKVELCLANVVGVGDFNVKEFAWHIILWTETLQGL